MLLPLIAKYSRSLITLSSNRLLHVRGQMDYLLDLSKIKGMKELDRDKFRSTVYLPALKVQKNEYGNIRKLLKAYLLDSSSFVGVHKHTDLAPSDSLHVTHKYLLLNPKHFDYDKLDPQVQQQLKTSCDNALVHKVPVVLTYDNLRFDDCVKAILPDALLDENLNVRSYSTIGHIAHFNLRDKILEYKNIIAQILLDKCPQIKTVVNKLNAIDNTYRNFAFEVLAGKSDSTMVECKESGCLFRFDFATVYWNPRLGSEHERIVDLVCDDDVVYDVFAGVGPFSVPCASKKKCTVLANDLNPNSYRYLCDNYTLNNKSKTKQMLLQKRQSDIKRLYKVPERLFPGCGHFNVDKFFFATNFDGADFINKQLKIHFVEHVNFVKHNVDALKHVKYRVLMNLPALAVEFLDRFVNLYNAQESELIRDKLLSAASCEQQAVLNVFCYCFCKTDEQELAKFKEHVTRDILFLNDSELKMEARFVRKVAPNKDMYCLEFALKLEQLLYDENKQNLLQVRREEQEKQQQEQKQDKDEPEAKKSRVE